MNNVTHIPIISEIDYKPIKPNKGLVGFVSFLYDNSFYMGSIGVHTLLNPTAERLYRLTYPTDNNTKQNYYHPINKEIAQIIDKEINCYIENLLKT